MDLIFRGISRAAGVEMRPGTALPWEAPKRDAADRAGTAEQTYQQLSKTTRRVAGKTMSYLGNRLIRAGDALAS